jgi:hypothetical protein
VSVRTAELEQLSHALFRQLRGCRVIAGTPARFGSAFSEPRCVAFGARSLPLVCEVAPETKGCPILLGSAAARADPRLAGSRVTRVHRLYRTEPQSRR